MLLPEVIGFKLTGKLKEGMTATDLVLTVTQMLRKRGVVGKFVEFFGPGLADLSIADRATIGNMAPEYGATCGFFPIDDDTIEYLNDTGRAGRRGRAGRGLCQGAGHVPHQDHAGPDLHRHAQARSRQRRALARRPEAAAGPRAAEGGEVELHGDGKEFNKALAARRFECIHRDRADKDFDKPAAPVRPGRRLTISATATW